MDAWSDQSRPLADGRSAIALWLARAGQVELRREPLPIVGDRDVRIRALASAISHGSEMLVYRGLVPANLAFDLPTLRGSFQFPIKYGYASVGRVVEVGPEVRGLLVHDLVFSHHPHQTEYVVSAEFAAPLGNIDSAAGVFLANMETAVNVMLDAAPRLGERVAVFGQGVVGLLLTQLLARSGVGLIAAIDLLPARRALALDFGATVALAPGETLAPELLRLTAGVGVDLAFEVSGNPQALDLAIQAVAFQGTVVVCSWYGAKPVPLHLGDAFHRRRLRLISSQVSNIDPSLQPRWSRERRLALARDLVSRLPLDQLITHRIPFRQAAAAYQLIDERPEDTCQVILTYEDEDV